MGVGGDPLKPVHAGQAVDGLPAAMFNTLMDSARWTQQQQRRVERGNVGTRLPAGMVLVRNDTGADVDRFGVMGIDGPIFGPDDNLDEFESNFALKGKKPTNANRRKFVVAVEPIEDGEIGRCWAAGVFPVSVSVLDATDQFAEAVVDDTAKLTSAADGRCRILWAESGTGTKWAIVHLGVAEPTTFPAIISASAGLADNRWSYTFAEVRKDSTGTDPADWVSRGGGRGGTAYNTMELPNTASGVQGNGVDVDNLPTGFTLQPITTNVIVDMRPVRLSDGATEYWFSSPNGVDGTCPS